MALWLRTSPTISLVLAAACALQNAQAMVCYLSQEIDSASGQHGWAINARNPSDCTEFQLGGVNVGVSPAQQHRPILGETSRPTVVKPLPDDTSELGSTTDSVGLIEHPCPTFTGVHETLILSAPVQLDFSVETESGSAVQWAEMELSSDLTGLKAKLYINGTIIMASLNKEGSGSANGKILGGTYDAGRSIKYTLGFDGSNYFTLAVLTIMLPIHIPDVLVPTLNEVSQWEMTISSDQRALWKFYGKCDQQLKS